MFSFQRPALNSKTDNSYHVFYHPAALALDDTAVLDGFVITGGYANGTVSFNRGGGMYNAGCSPTVIDCTFADNYATAGGGMANEEASPTVTNCTFVNNLATNGGGGLASYSSRPTVTNCTFSGNDGGTYGGGIYNASTSVLTATNCILWGDTPGEIAYMVGSTQRVNYSDVQGTSHYPGHYNINDDPAFQDPAAGDFHLRPNSPCIDSGTNDTDNLPTTDFEGDPRVADGNLDGTPTVDMGVDEVAVYTLTVSYAGNGSGLVSLSPPAGVYTPTTVVTLTAVASHGSSFAGWSGDAAGTTNPAALTMDADKAVTATFVTHRVYIPLLMRHTP